MYRDLDIQYPSTMFTTMTDGSTVKRPANFSVPDGFVENRNDIPDWVREQRYSWHGVDYMYHGTIVFEDFYYRYLETLQGVAESIGQVMKYLADNGLEDNTVVIYMGDNGFSFGDHGLLDKRPLSAAPIDRTSAV